MPANYYNMLQEGKLVPRKRKYRYIDGRLATLKTRLQNTELSPVQYADAASYLLHIDLIV